MAESPETKVNFRKDLMKEVMKTCDLTGHSAKMFIEECVKTCLEQIYADGEVTPKSALVTFARMKLGKDTIPLNQQVEKLVEKEFSKKISGAVTPGKVARSGTATGTAASESLKVAKC